MNHVNNKISHACKSKVMSLGNVTFHENAMSHQNFTSCLVKIPRLISCISMPNIAFYTQNIYVATLVHTCRNKVIVERYHSYVITSIKSSLIRLHFG